MSRPSSEVIWSSWITFHINYLSRGILKPKSSNAFVNFCVPTLSIIDEVYVDTKWKPRSNMSTYNDISRIPI